MGTVQQDAIAAKYNLASFLFQAANVPDGAVTAVTLNADSNDYVMPAEGSVVAMSVRHNADLTGGVITWTPTINGVANTGISAVTDDTNQQAYTRKEYGAAKFAAGDRLGAAGTKTGTVAPTTTDAVIVLLVLFKGMDF